MSLVILDKAMIRVIKEHKIMSSLFGNQLNMDEQNKTIAFERNNLIFVFNYHPVNSIPDYKFPVPKAGEYHLILNSDDMAFGGHGRVDPATRYVAKNDGSGIKLSIYNTNRTAQIFKRIV